MSEVSDEVGEVQSQDSIVVFGSAVNRSVVKALGHRPTREYQQRHE